MSRPEFAVLMIAIAVVVLLGMWWGWRARSHRDAATSSVAGELVGQVLATFPRANYVSTTPVGSPFERVALPGLRYKGVAAVTVRRDGVTIAVTGEDPVNVSSEQVLSTATANGRVGKVVEHDGLSLLRWLAIGANGSERELESSFRFAERTEQHRFDAAVAAILPPSPASRTSANPQTSLSQQNTQEDA